MLKYLHFTLWKLKLESDGFGNIYNTSLINENDDMQTQVLEDVIVERASASDMNGSQTYIYHYPESSHLCSNYIF